MTIFLARCRSVACLGLLALAPLVNAQDEDLGRLYPMSLDALEQPGVPAGTVTDFEFRDSEIFPGTVRRYSVFVPAQYDAAVPAALMVFQDGHTYVNPTGEFRVPSIFNNLIHRKEMPVTIGVFVDPGHRKDELPETRGWRPSPENRSVEYDSLGPDYAQFLLAELLPQVERSYNISADPAMRATCGLSSGGICAFTAAWERPDRFGKVLSHIGSFTNIRHGDTYPGLIRKTKTKPIRVYLQDGSGDLDNEHGSWWLGNQQMHRALVYKGYDVRFDTGEGGHNGRHGRALLPDALRWLWRDAPGVTQKLAIMPEIQTAPWAKSWWMPRHEAKIKEREAMEAVDLVMVGDSITHGWEDAGRAVWNEFYANRNALNLGFSGDRTEHVIWRLQNGAIDHIAPKLAVIMIGTNNTGHRMEDAQTTALGIERIVDEIRLRMPSTKVLLLSIFPRGETSDDPKRLLNDAINAQISLLAEDSSVTYLDLSATFLDDAGVLSKKIMPDLLHPASEGYRMWANAVEPTIAALMK